MKARTTRFLMTIALLAYWALSLNRLDALPTVREDEPWQAAPGYSFWTRGVYGSELFADFAHMDQHYYLFQPTFSLLLGLAARLWGLGLFQIRVVPVALGALTLCLTYVVGARLGGRAVGVLAVHLILLWRWSASTTTFASGVTLLDQSRIARYDTLVPVWGMAAWYALLHARGSQRARDYLLVGVCAGLAGLAHLYGLFWLGVCAVVLLWDARRNSTPPAPTSSALNRQPALTSIFLIALGALAAWTPWLLYIASGWQDFIAQTSNYANRFDVLNARFYLDNLLHEPLRYGLARATLTQAVTQPGVWLLVLGVPASLAWLWQRARATPTLRALLVPALVLPIAFALLLLIKTTGYALSVLPIFVIVIAYVAVHMWRTRRRAARALLTMAALLLALDSASGIANQQRWATESTSYREFMAQVRAIVPRSARVLALHQYWLGLAENDFRSYTDVFFLTNPDYTRSPMTIDQAFELVAPDILLIDAILGDVIARGDDPARGDANAREFALSYHLYMDRHHVRELGRVSDKSYGTLIVYAISPWATSTSAPISQAMKLASSSCSNGCLANP